MFVARVLQIGLGDMGCVVVIVAKNESGRLQFRKRLVCSHGVEHFFGRLRRGIENEAELVSPLVSRGAAMEPPKGNDVLVLLQNRGNDAVCEQKVHRPAWGFPFGPVHPDAGKPPAAVLSLIRLNGLPYGSRGNAS